MDGQTLDALWADYAANAGPTGDRFRAIALGAASYRPDARDWGAGLEGRQINILDLGNFRLGWDNARVRRDTEDDWRAWRNAWLPGGE